MTWNAKVKVIKIHLWAGEHKWLNLCLYARAGVDPELKVEQVSSPSRQSQSWRRRREPREDGSESQGSENAHSNGIRGGLLSL